LLSKEEKNERIEYNKAPACAAAAVSTSRNDDHRSKTSLQDERRIFLSHHARRKISHYLDAVLPQNARCSLRVKYIMNEREITAEERNC
jgi:hypothetical protein